ncbi:MAG: hypothetical protein UR52_C0001G0103 [Candidatus Gottesmanbacteria bacterium GW2011_GWA1_34_13]|uniref:Glycosyltransferase RgtA/B/C/D-like domain-containing protein n=1 Tax=Candidatus Gottesmanbacteria bacterium GW2011_GWA1_34_13 TaxID=1618434 RepID=A0A0G0ASF7_9BACT|nr:MAG: hypothetical protein UR52_C0001G0103 [Candidatus Gottesmanbacteria bacterium GW2011_GWA1_34_13]
MKKLNFNKKLLLIVFLAAIIRLPWLDKYPPALYSDEVSQGYNAYSVLKTAKDEYGKFLPVSFRSFGDWKPPLPTYLMVPTVAIFGLNAYGVRLPSAIFGIATVYLSYFISIELLNLNKSKNIKKHFKYKNMIALISALLLAISPWHISQSRSAMLVSIALFWLCLALWSFLKGLKNPRFWYVSGISFIMATYSYYGLRVIVPIFLIYLGFQFNKQIAANLKTIIFTVLISIIMMLPIIVGFIKEPDIVFGRAKTVSIFYDQGVVLTVADLIRKDGQQFPPKLAQYFHNKPYSYAVDVIRRFGEHFDGRFLFLYGDAQTPFQIPNMGILYIIDGIFILLGLIYLIRYDVSIAKLVFAWLAICIIPAALTFITPSSNRTFNMIVPLEIIISVGIVYFVSRFIKFAKYIILAISILYIVNFGYFLKQYIVVLPKYYADWWHGGYPELISYLASEENMYSGIYISGKASVPYIFYLFYRQYDPKLLQTQIHRNFKADKFGFEHVDSIGKYYFPRYYDWNTDKETFANNSLLVLTPQETANGLSVKQQIYYPDRESAFKIYNIDK